jgi:hypothetical protein
MISVRDSLKVLDRDYIVTDFVILFNEPQVVPFWINISEKRKRIPTQLCLATLLFLFLLQWHSL